MIFLSSFNPLSFANANAQTKNDEVIAKVNGENIYLSEYRRLFNAQKKKFKTSFNFDLFTKNDSASQAELKRKELLLKAKNEGIFQTSEEFNKSWEELINNSGSYGQLENKAKEKGLTTADVKTKLKENITLEKYFERHIRDKILNIIIDEAIVLQEAKGKNLQISQEEINKTINSIKEKQGGEEGFNAFLSENNATIEDLEKEISNKILYNKIKETLTKEKTDFNSYINKKKAKADIIVYHHKITTQEKESLQKLPPQKMAESLVPGEAVISEAGQEINTLNIFKKNNSTVQSIQSLNDPKEALTELRRKLEEKRVSIKQ